jgi:hypothetical protein
MKNKSIKFILSLLIIVTLLISGLIFYSIAVSSHEPEAVEESSIEIEEELNETNEMIVDGTIGKAVEVVVKERENVWNEDCWNRFSNAVDENYPSHFSSTAAMMRELLELDCECGYIKKTYERAIEIDMGRSAEEEEFFRRLSEEMIREAEILGVEPDSIPILRIPLNISREDFQKLVDEGEINLEDFITNLSSLEHELFVTDVGVETHENT